MLHPIIWLVGPSVHPYPSGFLLGVCGYTRTRGFTRTRPVPADRVRVGYAFHGSGRVRVRSSRVRVYPFLPVPTWSFVVKLSLLHMIVNLAPSKTYYGLTGTSQILVPYACTHVHYTQYMYTYIHIQVGPAYVNQLCMPITKPIFVSYLYLMLEIKIFHSSISLEKSNWYYFKF